MIKCDFSRSYIDDEKYNELFKRKDEIYNLFLNDPMNGWINEVSTSLIEDIKVTANHVKKEYDLMIVIGIGGSFLGSLAFNNLFKKKYNDNTFKIIYVGSTLSSSDTNDLIEYLKNKKFCINVISKSGNTLETNIMYNKFKEVLKEKYKDISKHIIISTNSSEGKLREEVVINNYKMFVLPDNIGGRFSFITAAHLFPLALNYNIDDIINSYYSGKSLKEEAFKYAITRNLLFNCGKLCWR